MRPHKSQEIWFPVQLTFHWMTVKLHPLTLKKIYCKFVSILRWSHYGATYNTDSHQMTLESHGADLEKTICVPSLVGLT